MKSLKIIASLLLLSASYNTLAHCNHCTDYKCESTRQTPPLLMSGFYAGGQLGYDVFRIRQDFDVSVTGGLTFLAGDPPLAVKGFSGGLFVGYGMPIRCCFYIGAEAYANLNQGRDGINIASADDFYSARIRIRNNYGFSILPGWTYNHDARAYLRLGYGWTNFHVSENITNFILPADASDSERKNLGGWHVGLGLEKLICSHFSYRAEYKYTRFKNLRTNTLANHYKPTDYQIMLSVLYHL